MSESDNPFTITKQFTFSAAHRIPGHPKCGRMHGHNYVVNVTVTRYGPQYVDGRGFVVDFGELSEICMQAFVRPMDHRYLCGSMESSGPIMGLESNEIHYLTVPYSTAEYLAQTIGRTLQPQLPSDIGLVRIDVWETATSCATFYAEEA